MECVAIWPWWGGEGAGGRCAPSRTVREAKCLFLKIYYLEVFFVLKLFLLAISWGGSWVSLGGEVELFGGEASPAPPSLDETLIIIVWQLIELCFILFIIELLHFGDCIIFRFWLYLLCLSL